MSQLREQSLGKVRMPVTRGVTPDFGARAIWGGGGKPQHHGSQHDKQLFIPLKKKKIAISKRN